MQFYSAWPFTYSALKRTRFSNILFIVVLEAKGTFTFLLECSCEFLRVELVLRMKKDRNSLCLATVCREIMFIIVSDLVLYFSFSYHFNSCQTGKDLFALRRRDFGDLVYARSVHRCDVLRKPSKPRKTYTRLSPNLSSLYTRKTKLCLNGRVFTYIWSVGSHIPGCFRYTLTCGFTSGRPLI